MQFPAFTSGILYSQRHIVGRISVQRAPIAQPFGVSRFFGSHQCRLVFALHASYLPVQISVFCAIERQLLFEFSKCGGIYFAGGCITQIPAEVFLCSFFAPEDFVTVEASPRQPMANNSMQRMAAAGFARACFRFHSFYFFAPSLMSALACPDFRKCRAVQSSQGGGYLQSSDAPRHAHLSSG